MHFFAYFTENAFCVTKLKAARGLIKPKILKVKIFMSPKTKHKFRHISFVTIITCIVYVNIHF